jgi:thiol:disulfide interchange protein DsbD
MKKNINTILILLLTLCLSGYANSQIFDLANFDNNTDKTLSFDEAFYIDKTISGNKITIYLKTEKGHYLYKDKFVLTSTEGTLSETSEWDNVTFKNDEFFGLTPIIENQGSFSFHIYEAEKTILNITAQGCSKEGICYLPSKKTFHIDNIKIQPPEDATYNYWSFFLIGFLISLTPCTFPMIPIVLAAIGKNKTRSTVAYFHGLATTFISIGLLTTMSGSLITVHINNIYTTTCIALFFLIIGALLYKDIGISIGQKTAPKIELFFNKIKSETGKSYVIGAASGILATPCTAAPLLAVFTHLSLEADVPYTITALYLLCLGITCPLIIIALTGNNILLKPGKWMLHVKAIIAAIIISYPAILLNNYNETVSIIYGCVAITLITLIFAKEHKVYFIIPLILTLSLNIPEKEELISKQIMSIKEVEQGKIILKIEADWCASCKVNSKTLQSLNTSEYKILSLDVTDLNDMEENYLKKHNILGVPMIHIINNNRITHKIGGEITLEQIQNALK